MMRRFLHIFGFHHWKYHNPFDRTCKICGRWEQEYFYPHEKGLEVYGGMRGWNRWEVQGTGKWQ